MDTIPDLIYMEPPMLWQSRSFHYNFTETQKKMLSDLDDLFCTDIRSRAFLYRILTEYPFLLNSEEKFAF